MRLFVSLALSPAVKQALLDASNALRQQGTGTFTRAENLHLTLAFIGETADPDSAKAALAEACVKTNAFLLTVGGLGRFGDLWWAGVRENEPLEALALAVQAALRRKGFSIEERDWTPHITLVRNYRGPAPVGELVPARTMAVTRVSLMQSERSNGSVVYTEVFGIPLGHSGMVHSRTPSK